MLDAKTISNNWDKFINIITQHISEPRRGKLIEFYEKHKEVLILMPAAPRKSYHNAFPGGYIDHIIRVVEAALSINTVWENFGVETSDYTEEELVFSALNHDLGKMGDGEFYSYLPQDNQWRKDNLGEMYKFDTRIQFMKVPDRSLYLLAQAGVNISENEWIAIQTHDGLYDEGNTAYLKAFQNECRPRTALPFIIHQADMLAARIEWEKVNLPEFKENLEDAKKSSKVKTTVKKKDKALTSFKSDDLKKAFEEL